MDYILNLDKEKEIMNINEIQNIIFKKSNIIYQNFN